MVFSLQPAHTQDNISWLDDYTGEMQIGSETYQYNFSNVENNDCKLKFEELVTNKKGSTLIFFFLFKSISKEKFNNSFNISNFYLYNIFNKSLN